MTAIEEIMEGSDYGPGAYKDFLSAGLGNPSTFCYLNSLLQTFSASDNWRVFFRDSYDMNPAIKAVSDLLEALSKPFRSGKVESTKAVRKTLRKVGLQTFSGVQGDINEFYIHLLDVIERLFTVNKISPFTGFATEMHFPSQFVYQETIKCPLCNHINCRVHRSSNFIVSALDQDLETSLANFFGPQELESHCDNCNRFARRTISRRITFRPKTLMVFVTRRDNYDDLRYSRAPFSFPLKISLNNYSLVHKTPKKSDNGLLKMSLNGIPDTLDGFEGEFQLTSVVVFRGEDNAGHFYVHRQHREELPPYARRWVCSDDSHVYPSSYQNITASERSCLLLQYDEQT